MELHTTKPGYKVSSSSFIVEFIAARRIWGEEEGEYREELEDDCDMIMMDLVNAFQMWPGDMAMVKREAQMLLDLDIRSENIERPGINTFKNKVQISNDTFSRKPGDRIKKVHVHLKDEDANIKLMYIFEVKKKQEMKMLQTLAAEKISNCVSKKKDFEHLEMPKQLLSDLNKSYDDIWRVNLNCKHCNANLEDMYFFKCPSNINITHKFCLTCCRDSIIMQGSGTVAFCPSGRRCQPQDISVPVALTQEEIETTLEVHPDKALCARS